LNPRRSSTASEFRIYAVNALAWPWSFRARDCVADFQLAQRSSPPAPRRSSAFTRTKCSRPDRAARWDSAPYLSRTRSRSACREKWLQPN